MGGDTMTHAERRAIREKHKENADGLCGFCDWEGRGSVEDYAYPCEIVKVLDYLDKVDPMPEVK
jgi:hypothetical protein